PRRLPPSTLFPYTTLFRSSGDLGRALHQMPRLVGHLHLDEDVAREEAPLADRLLPALHLDHFLGRHQHLAELVLHARALDAVEEDRKSTRLNSSHVAISYA